ncbi:DnaJ chaperone [Histoplasma capsulatum G186AR]|uniref:DnaJ chaperone n=1 Tax=Ajellomyces capsulatus TaxID=5037 RepID=A0A8H8CRX9_AJECA|nr:DnaJ chaperone [Histoplasma capsulatum]QSS71027.1 DnaJ chaperone [Histoplasma capsulatum G186AR]
MTSSAASSGVPTPLRRSHLARQQTQAQTQAPPPPPSPRASLPPSSRRCCARKGWRRTMAGGRGRRAGSGQLWAA